jgi:predicted transcriptional regulator
MKTAISIPDDLFEEVERFSRRLKVSRSRLFTDAAREYLARQAAPSDATMLWNKVIAEAGQPGDDPASVAVRRRNKAALRQGLTKRR